MRVNVTFIKVDMSAKLLIIDLYRLDIQIMSKTTVQRRVAESNNLGKRGVVLSKVLIVVSIEDGLVGVARSKGLGTRFSIYIVLSSSVSGVVRSLMDHASVFPDFSFWRYLVTF